MLSYINPTDIQALISPLDKSEDSAILSHYLHKDNRQESEALRGRVEAILKRRQITEKQVLSEPSSPFRSSHTLFGSTEEVPFSVDKSPNFTFIDLFAGIGGFRIACQNLGGRCVYSSEIDVNAKCTYYHNFGDVPFGDITRESVQAMIPSEFDLLCAGFPCQAFSIAGYQRGFEDARGTLFFEIAKITKAHRPKVLLLENVKNLMKHDKGNTFRVIQKTLEDLDYRVHYKILNAMDYADIPQNRERIFIVAVDKRRFGNLTEFEFPDRMTLTHTIHDCIDYSVSEDRYFYNADKMSHYDKLKQEIKSPNSIYQWRRQYVRENKSNVCPTLTANMGTGGHNVPLILTPDGIRKLTPKECLRFQGYPADFEFPSYISISAKYKQAGNSVVVPLIQRICQSIVNQILV